MSQFFRILFYLLLFAGGAAAAAAADTELGYLLEFKKGIKGDPLGKVLTQWDPASLPDPGSCPGTWPGITCDPDSGSVAGISLDRLGLSGDIKFSTLLGLKSLRNLSLAGNDFTGRLVPAMGSMSTLQHLDLSENNFSGPIPGRIADLWDLRYLNLSRNSFSGWFPAGGSFRNLQQLRVLDIHANDLSGDVAAVFGELVAVEYLDFSGNHFGGGVDGLVPANVSGLANTARVVNLSGNGLSGGFWREDVIGLFRSLEVLDLGSCGVNGQLPSFGSLAKLTVLRLGNNSLFGPVPEELVNGSVPLNELDLSLNGFTGSVQRISSTSLSSLNLSSNGLSGPLPTINGTCVVVDLSRNSIFGNISDIQQWGAKPAVLDLSSNKLFGSLPNLTFQFSRLTKINLRNNSVDGTLPPLLWESSGLSDIDLSSNRFSGQLPSGFFTLLALINVNLSSNQLNGPIPLRGSGASELVSLPSSRMESLDLSHNFLVSDLTSDIGNFALLKLLNLSNNELSGKLPVELRKLTFLQYLDLSENKFEGSIPDKLPTSLISLNLSDNDFSGKVPDSLRSKFDISSFRPGNPLLIFPGSPNSVPGQIPDQPHRSKGRNIRTPLLVAVSVLVCVFIAAFLFSIPLIQRKRSHTDDTRQLEAGEDAKKRRVSRPSIFKFRSDDRRAPTSLSFSNDHLLASNSRSLSGQPESTTSTVERGVSDVVAATLTSDVQEIHPEVSGRKSSPGSPLSNSPRFVESHEHHATLDVYSPDRLAGQLFFLDASLAFTAEDLSRAPAEVLGRSSHGTLYKAILDSGHMLTVKWLRVGLVKNKKDFAKEVKKIGSIRHPNIVPLRAYYWGPREQERLLLADYVQGDSLALHLYETTPRRYSLLSLSQRLKVAVDVACCLLYLHDRGQLHGNLKPSNILLDGPEYIVRLSDYGLHRLMTPAGVAEQMLNLGALGYRAPELAGSPKPAPSFKADVYAFGVILMELLTRRSPGDIISGQSGAVDLTDWVRLCDQEGRRMDCLDGDIAGREEPPEAMDDLLGISLRCILPVNERPNIRQVLDDLSSVSV